MDRPPGRAWLSWFANKYLRIVLGLKLCDCSSGFKCCRKEALASLPLDSIRSVGPSIDPRMVWMCQQLGYRIREVPITFRDRVVGESKLMNEGVLLEALLNPLRLRWREFCGHEAIET